MQTDTLPLGSSLSLQRRWHLDSFFHFSGLGFLFLIDLQPLMLALPASRCIINFRGL